MRTINKRAEPDMHTEWRARNQGDVNYGYDLMDSKLRKVVKKDLLKEQGWICAYTGKRLEFDPDLPTPVETCHIEHLRPQKMWKAHRGLDVDYQNMVACWPEPGHKPEPEYGARFKDKWPKPGEESLFVSPLSAGCEARFVFSFKGVISTLPADSAAAKTVKKIGLDHPTLTALRQSEIAGVLGKERSMKLKDAKARLKILEEEEAQLKQGADVRLNPYCFALQQALRRHIKTLEHIKSSTRRLIP